MTETTNSVAMEKETLSVYRVNGVGFKIAMVASDHHSVTQHIQKSITSLTSGMSAKA